MKFENGITKLELNSDETFHQCNPEEKKGLHGCDNKVYIIKFKEHLKHTFYKYRQYYVAIQTVLKPRII